MQEVARLRAERTGVAAGAEEARGRSARAAGEPGRGAWALGPDAEEGETGRVYYTKIYLYLYIYMLLKKK